MRTLALIHPAQGGVPCRTNQRGHPPTLPRGAKFVNTLPVGRVEFAPSCALRNVSSGILPNETCNLPRRMARLTWSHFNGELKFSPGGSLGASPRAHPTPKPRLRAGWIHANARIPTAPVTANPCLPITPVPTNHPPHPARLPPRLTQPSLTGRVFTNLVNHSLQIS